MIDHSIKHFLVSAKVANRDTNKYKNVPCNAKRFSISQNIQDICKFEDADCNKSKLWKEILNCIADFTLYKFHCSSCYK